MNNLLEYNQLYTTNGICNKVLWCSGYHVCLTRKRSPVRSWAAPKYVFSTFYFFKLTVSCLINKRRRNGRFVVTHLHINIVVDPRKSDHSLNSFTNPKNLHLLHRRITALSLSLSPQSKSKTHSSFSPISQKSILNLL